MRIYPYSLVSALLILALTASVGIVPTVRAAEGAGTIKGSLVDQAGQPLTGYKVRVVDESGQPFESQPTGPDGAFEIPDLPPGNYSYQIVDPQGNTVGVKIPAVQLAAGTVVTQPIAIIPSDDKPGGAARWAVPASALTVLAGLIVINNNNDNNNDDDDTPPMTASGN